MITQSFSFEACCGHVRHLTILDHSEAACAQVLAQEKHIPCAKCLEAEQGLAGYGAMQSVRAK